MTTSDEAAGTGVTTPSLLDLDRLERDLPALREQYANARPFPHIVLDGLLRPGVVDRARCEFPAVDDTWTSYLHVNERKYGNTNADSWGPTLQAIARTLTSDRMLRILDALTGHEGLLADWSMDGGGLHQSFAGGFLNVHSDFTSHHTERDWRRRVNLLLYLNREWPAEWGGDLELWATDMSRCEARIAPIANRAVVFTTSEDSFHGFPVPTTCPPDVARQSMALYYFEHQDRPLTRSTDYRARPDDSVATSAAIYVDKQVLHVYDVVKRRLHLPDDAASRVLRFVRRHAR